MVGHLRVARASPDHGTVGHEPSDRPARNEEEHVSDNTGEKLKGVAKETAGKVTGSDDMKHEGEQQQKKAQKDDEASRLAAEAQEKKQEAAGHEGQQRKHE
jgi:uncharacterized protein YjbJ (UPF0337 family)